MGEYYRNWDSVDKHTNIHSEHIEINNAEFERKDCDQVTVALGPELDTI